MKYAVLPIIIFLAIIGLAASHPGKKTVTERKELAGKWSGTYSVDDGPMVNDIFFDFVQGELVHVFDGSRSWGDEAKGNYSMNGDTLTGSYVFNDGLQNPVIIKAVVNVKDHQLTGTWQWLKDKGFIQLSKAKD